MNDTVKHELLVPQTDDELIDVLVNSLYPGARRESAAMVLGYCRAAGLDPLIKPVHIVPMRVKSGIQNRYGNDEYIMRDTVMPGIGLYRIQAARTGQYAGLDEPLLGPMRTMHYTAVKREWIDVPGRDKKQPKDTFTEKELHYPEWVQITVYRMLGGFRCAYHAREYWMENYATAGADSDAPNAMWARRTIGQLVKCAEAQALRKGFPEVGSQPTAEEMEGRAFEADVADLPEAVDVSAKAVPQRASAVAAGNVSTPALADGTAEQQAATALVPAVVLTPTAEPAAPPQASPPTPPPVQPPAVTAPAGEPASEGERNNILVTARAKRKDLAGVLHELGLALNSENLAGLTKAEFKSIKARL